MLVEGLFVRSLFCNCLNRSGNLGVLCQFDLAWVVVGLTLRRAVRDLVILRMVCMSDVLRVKLF